MFTKDGGIYMPVWERILVLIVVAFSVSSIFVLFNKYVDFHDKVHINITITTEEPLPPVNNESFVSRPEWSARPPRGWPQPLSILPPPYVIISHSVQGSCTSFEQCRKAVQLIQKHHMVANHWPDIAYNFLVGGDGNVYEGRGWDVKGAHAQLFNNRSIGISFIGTFIEVAPPARQLLAAEKIIEHGVRIGKIRADYKLLGHRQVSKTESPGETLYRIIKTWDHWSPEP